MTDSSNNNNINNVNNSTKHLKENEKYIPYSLIKDSISETDLKKETIEESSTNLFYETLSGKGKLFLKSGFLYYGPVKYGILTSEDTDENCEIKFPDGTIYVGEIKDNEITGTGKYYFPTGAIYSGELLSGLRHGYGKFESPNEGLTYEGNWKKGLKNGNGIMKKKGCMYEGNWKDGCIDGRGKLTWASGNIYKGDFVKGKLNGDGYMIWYNESKKYTGHWENNLQNGYGVQIWFEGKGEHKYLFNRYIGEWKNGKRNGYGIFYYSNGAKYEGTWKDDNKDGFGIFTFSEGKKFIGLFKDDRFCGNIQNQISENVVLKYLNDYKTKFVKTEKSSNSPKKTAKRKSVTTDFGFGNQANKAKLSVIVKRENRATLAFTNNINSNNLDIQYLDKKENEKKQNEQNQNVLNPVNATQPENLPLKMKNINFDKFHTDYKVIEENSDKSLPKTKQNKSLNRFIPFLQYQKISLIQPDIFEFKKEIENIILQNLTEIRRWYQYSNRLVLESEETRLKREEKIFSPQECVYTNKVYLCMELKDLWRIFRDSGIMSAQFSLSCFDRMLYYDEYNQTDLIFIKKNSDDQENIYKELYEKLTNFKNNFAFENQAYALYYYMTEDSEMNKYLYNLIDKYKIESNLNNNNKDINKLDKINEENKLIDKYEDLLSEKDINYEKTNKLCFDVNNSHNPLLLYQFYNSLLYASILYFSFSPNDYKAYEKFKRIIDFINSSKPNFKRGGSKNKTGMSKLESSFMNKANEALNEAQRIRNYDYMLIDDFYKDYSSKLMPIFEKVFILSKHGKFYNKNDKTLDYSYFYYNIIKKIELLKDIFKNKIAYIDIISHFHSSIIDNSKENNAIKNVNNNSPTKNDTKVTKKESENININNKDNIIGGKGDRNENNNIDNDKDINGIKEDESDSDIEKLKQVMEEKIISTDNCEKYKIVEGLLYNEMNFYEFVELIFFICRKYYLNKYPNAIFIEMQVPRKEKTKEKQKEKQNIKQREKDTFMKIINLINQEVNEFEKKSKENTNKGKFKYKFPELKSHRMKKELIRKEEKKKELMKLKEKEIKRYTLERENLAEEDNNVYFEEAPEEVDDTSEEEY